MEHSCNAIRATRPADIRAYDTCLSTQLLSLRTDFGRDLVRLAPAERRTIDAACNKIRTAEGRDAYVACLSRQVSMVRSRRGIAAPVEPSTVTTAPPPPASPAPAAQLPGAQKDSSSLTVAAVGIAALMAVGAAGLWLMMKRRRPSASCRACGAAVPGGGDLCQRCRHQAAEAQRRAAIERTQSERAQESPVGQYDAQDDQPGYAGQMGQVGQVGQASRMGELELAGQVGQLGQVGGQLGRVSRVGNLEQAGHVGQAEQVASWHDELRRSYEMAEPSEFDPHVILGLLPNASREAIDGAYREARARYDAEQVAHLGPEAREHFRVKAEAVERAYRMLAAGDNASQEPLV